MTSIEMTNTVHFALDVGEQLLMCGGEVPRAEDTVERICLAYGAERVDVFAINSALWATAAWEDGTVVTQNRRVKNHKKNMHRLERLNALSRKVCAEQPVLPEARAQFAKILEKDRHWFRRELIGAILVAMSCTLFFGGDWKDTLVAPVVGVSIILAQWLSGKIGGNRFLSQIMCSFIATTISIFAVKWGLGSSVEQIMIGCIMILIPGIAFTHAVENLITGDTLSGLLSSCEAIFVALGLAGGFAASVLLFGGSVQEVVREVSTDPTAKAIMQIVTAGIMAVGFGFIFGVYGKKLIAIGLGSALTWMVYLGVYFISDQNYGVATFVAAFVGGYGATLMAQLLKAPKTVFLFPLLVSLVPGSDLYRTMQAVLDGNKAATERYGIKTLIIAFAIAFGIIVMVVCSQTQMKINRHIEERRGKKT